MPSNVAAKVGISVNRFVSEMVESALAERRLAICTNLNCFLKGLICGGRAGGSFRLREHV